MAHFAELDDNNKVLRVIVVHNNELLDENGNENEQKGIDFCVDHFGGKWIQTSYNDNFRHSYAGIGMYYEEDLDIFRPAQPYPSWTYDFDKKRWEPPIPRPGLLWTWDEENQQFLPPNI